MRIFNLGSINIDLVYRVPHIPAPGETLASTDLSRGLGGKGANMSVAAAACGAEVRHFGAVGPDGGWTLESLAGFGVDTAGVARLDVPTGHAVIMVSNDGENAITLFPGANFALPGDLPRRMLDEAAPGDWLLVQSETSRVAQSAALARERGLKVAYAAAPFDAKVALGMLDRIDLLAVNEGEAAALAEAAGRPVADLGVGMVLVTRGAQGAVLHRECAADIERPAWPAEVVDTTGAGDTTLGYFLGALAEGMEAGAALDLAMAAAALQVGRPGASSAVPARGEVDAFLKKAR